LQNDRFTFKHIDVKNNIYNPSGKYNVKDFIFPYENGSFDFILLKSVFTHMNAEDINSYLAEINRLLSQHGRALITLFLLDAEQTKLADQGRNALKFSFGDDNCKWVYKNRPESAIAYSTDTVFEMVKRNKLTVKEPIYYGTWSGREDGVSFQDLIVIQKDSNGVT
jgi:SAM-dependent methyltransferase